MTLSACNLSHMADGMRSGFYPSFYHLRPYRSVLQDLGLASSGTMFFINPNKVLAHNLDNICDPLYIRKLGIYLVLLLLVRSVPLFSHI